MHPHVVHGDPAPLRRRLEAALDLPESVVNRIARWLTRVPGGAHFRERLLDPATETPAKRPSGPSA
ncbi:hypothetical protein [Rhodocaloribacter sp.]